MKILIPILCLLMLSGCSFARTMTVQAKIDDAKYGIAEGNGYGVYESKTTFKIFHK